MRLVAGNAVARVMGMVGRGDERVREMTIDLLRPGDELYWTDGTTYRGMSDGTIAVYGGHREGMRRRKTELHRAADLAAAREKEEEERMAAELDRLREMTEMFGL